MRSVQAEVRQIELDEEMDNLDDEDSFDDELEFEDLGEDGDSLFDALLDDELARPRKRVSNREQRLNKAEVEADLGIVPSRVKRLNRKHALAFVNGKTVVITENPDGTVSYGSLNELHSWYENDRVSTEKATEPVSKYWMKHKKRREYPYGIVFAPQGASDGYYNHWRGFSVEPDATKSCRLILSHVRKVLCNGDDKLYAYFIGWLAHMIQHPEEKPGVAVVLRGKKGAGKDTIADYVGKLFPHHHVVVANQEHMVGRFNAHQEKCLLLHVQEGFWAGNKNAEGSLKYLITSEKVFIEPKGINGFHVDSVLRLFMSSNEDWVVPATSDERRYFVLDVPPTKVRDHKYFDAIRHERANGGLEALLAFLQNYDLNNFNVRDVPSTVALGRQKVQGLKNIERWWFSMLESGELDMSSYSAITRGKSGKWEEEGVIVDRNDFREAYERWMRSRRYDGEALDQYEVGRRLYDMVRSIRMVMPRIDGKQRRAYVFPDLEVCRREFEMFIRSEVIWPHEHFEPDDSDEDIDYDDF
jgi:hypothetical protein